MSLKQNKNIMEKKNYGWSENSIVDSIMFMIMAGSGNDFGDIEDCFGEDIETITKFVEKNKITDRDQIEVVFDEYSIEDLYGDLNSYLLQLVWHGGAAMKASVKDLKYMAGHCDGISFRGKTLNFVFQNESGLDGKVIVKKN